MMLCIRTKNLTCVLDEYHVYYIGIVNTTSQQEYILLLYRREGEYPTTLRYCYNPFMWVVALNKMHVQRFHSGNMPTLAT